MKHQLTYYEYWGLEKAPFDNVPDPEMFFEMHASVGDAVAETLFAIEEGNECLVVIVGEVGLGKTMALRVILDSLDAEQHRIAFVANPDLEFSEIMREVIGQLQGKQCTITGREQLLETFNHILFDPQDTRRVLLFIDEGNALKPENLESLRLLTNMQRDDENVLTIVLAGQMELAQTLEKPAHANLFQRIGVYCHLRKVENVELVRDYLEHRIERAGREDRIFTDCACEAILECSENGVPRLINKLAKLSLKVGQTYGLHEIDGAIVRHIGSRFRRVASVSPPPTPANASVAAASTQPDIPVTSGEPGKNGSQISLGRRTNGAQLAESSRLSGSEREAMFLSLFGDTATLSPHKAMPAVANTAAEPVHVMIAELLTFSDAEYDHAKQLDKDQQLKVAGQMAAKVLKQHPQLVRALGHESDPIPVWNILRMAVMHQIEVCEVKRETAQVGGLPS